jgi:hypothetical protein
MDDYENGDDYQRIYTSSMALSIKSDEADQLKFYRRR